MDTAIKTTTQPRRASDAPDCSPADYDAYSAFYDRYYRIHLGMIRSRYTRYSREESEDIVATAYLHLWQNWPKLSGQPDKAISAWVDVTASRRAIDRYRWRAMTLKHEMSREEIRARTNAARRSDHGTVQGEEADLIALATEYVAARDAATDPEHWAVVREELAEALAACAGHYEGEKAQRLRRTILSDAFGYTSAEIAADQGRSISAIKMDLMRARDRLGMPRQATHGTRRTMERTVAA